MRALSTLEAGPTLRIGAARGALEIKQFFREKDSVVFTFSLPVILLAVLGSIFSGRVPGTEVTFSQIYVAGMLAAGIMSTSLVNLGVSIAGERENGTLRRLYGTPMPRAAYFLGKVVLVVITGVAESVILVVIGVLAFDVSLPSTGARLFTLAWVSLLGMSASALLGIAVSSLPRSARSAGAVVNLPFVVLQFISGVFIPISELPDWLRTIGALFPLKWMTQGFRAAFLPDELQAMEPAGSWELGRVALVLAVWCVGGLVLCLMTFRWRSSRTG
jgi:ABC-2 type transport system permease protein